MLKAVVDTNVLVSGTILSRGNPYQVLEAWRRSQFILVLSPDIIAEIEAVLRRLKIFKKYGLSENLLARLVNALNAEALFYALTLSNILLMSKQPILNFWLAPTQALLIILSPAIEPSSNLNPTETPVLFPLAFSSLSFIFYRAVAE